MGKAKVTVRQPRVENQVCFGRDLGRAGLAGGEDDGGKE